MNFLKTLYFAILAHIHAKDTDLIFGTPHTQIIQIHTGKMDTHRHKWIPFSYFILFVSYMPKIQIHAHTCAETPANTDPDTHAHRYTQVHTDGHMENQGNCY